MAPQFSSIQSYFATSKPKIQTPARLRDKSGNKPGDGFTNAEMEAVLHPVIDDGWMPDQEYADADIGSLVPGPHRVMFQGRVANFYNQQTPSKRPQAAKGCLKIIVKDDTGAITVRLWYAKLEYQLRLGQLVTIWTPHISNGEHGNFASTQAPLFTSVFPERDRSCHFHVHENSDSGEQCRTPFGQRKNHALENLMTLKNFVDGGYDVNDCRILVCVKSIGVKKRVTPKSGKAPPNDCLSVQIFDSTQAAATLTLWGAMTASASTWQPAHTVLLITNPGWRIERSAFISIASTSLVDIDPAIPDTFWLRSFASRLIRREDINPAFPSKTQLDVKYACEATKQIYFTFADLDEFARTAPSDKFVGWVSVVLTQVNLSQLHRRNMLLSAIHCGLPIYGNALTKTCKQCSTVTTMRLNPKVLGPVVDETGCSQAGKLYLSDHAWEELLGLSTDDLCQADLETLEYLEQRMLYLRVNLGVAWWAEEMDASVGRLWVWAVRA